MSKPDLTVFSYNEEGFLFESGAVRRRIGEAILQDLPYLSNAKSAFYLGETVHQWTYKENTKKVHAFPAWKLSFSMAPLFEGGHYAFYVTHAAFYTEQEIPKDAEFDEGREGYFLMLAWEEHGREKTAWVRAWRPSEPELYGNEAWLGMPCEAPEILPAVQEVA